MLERLAVEVHDVEEDQEIGGPGLHPIADQARRVAAVVASGLWVNARTDLFLRKLVAGENPNDRSLLGEALERAHAYAEAGADSFFIPGVSDVDLIAEVCAASPLRAGEADEASIEILRDALRTNKKAIVDVNLALSDAEAQAFWPVYDRYQKELAGVQDRLVQVIETYRALMKKKE